METLSKSGQIIRSSFDEYDYDRLQQFFRNIWLSKAPYKVFMARRAFNLNFAFMDMMDAQYDDEYNMEGIMSNTALLLCAEEIADYYKVMECFPSILIVDDLLIHGRGIMKLVDSFEVLVWDYLKTDRMWGESREKFHRKLIMALSIYVFAKNVDGILLDERFALKAVMRLVPRELKRLSQQISRALQQCAVANTSYVLSASLPRSFFKDELADARNSREDALFQYRGNILLYYYRNLNNHILETLRFYQVDEKDSFKQKVTSLVLFGDISYSEDGFDQLCQEIADKVKEIIPYSRLVEILNYTQINLARPRAQMISYLLSILSFVSFCREKLSCDSNVLYGLLIHSDYKKIAANFGKSQRIPFEIVQLFRHVSHDDDLRKSIFSILEKYTDEFVMMDRTNDKEYQRGRWTQKDISGRDMSPETIYEMAEDIFYEVGMNAEYRANQLSQMRTKFMVSVPGNDFICLKQYMRIMKNGSVDEVPAVGYMLSLMDSGLFAMNLELNHSQKQKKMQCILKAGELSTFVLPRRFSVFMPALANVEQGYLKKGSNKKEVVKDFINFLQMYCYRNKECTEEELNLLEKLRQSISSLLYMYVAGQNLQDWNVNLLTNEDYLSHGIDKDGRFNEEQYHFWIINEKKKIQYYSFCAKIFFQLDTK